MKIISKEKNHSDIEHILKKDLLIPCFVYKIPIEISKNRTLNFIEETILKLIHIDESLKQDIERLSKMIGFYSEKKDEDKTKIVKLIVSKLKDLRLDDNVQDNKSEVIIYQFYQEAYTNELLPIITQELNDFSFDEKSYKFQDYDEYVQVEFKQSIGSKKNTKAILVNQFNEKFYKPSKADIIKTIFEHNQQKYKESHTIDYKDFKIETVGDPELIYLHVKLYMPSIKSFVVTNGFTNDFSPILRKLFENQHATLLNILKNETRVDAQKNQNWNIDIPFENSIDRYSNVKVLVKKIEEQSFILNNNDSSKDEIQKAKDLFAQNLYDVIEKTFAYLSQDLVDTQDLKKKELLNKLAQDCGFQVDNKRDLPIFKVYNNDNLQKYFAKALLYKKDELYDLAIKYPNILFILEILFDFRNTLKHSGQREETLLKIQTKKLFEYKDIIYKSISIILRVKQKKIKVQETTIDDSDSHFTNAYLDLENEFGIDVVNQFPQELKDNLLSINFALNGMDFEQNKSAVVNEVLTRLYSSIELLLRKKINNLPEKSSLGYIYNILVDKKYLSENDLKLIHDLKELRGHGNLSLEDVLHIKEKALRELKNNSFLFIRKLYEKI
ncbi:hypothetical protein L5F41_05590 [Aliarcobacter butzleri]|uniref:hypothetical protein n=1 Tax=Aliarcobacter butzleri TaxID=28197 RepID=UPI001EDA1047|nr:hypothetical protein [Aliarcobacter butzleri]MCG3701567.1 hypothetical protein [Aliarcobacter butzleri]